MSELQIMVDTRILLFSLLIKTTNFPREFLFVISRKFVASTTLSVSTSTPECGYKPFFGEPSRGIVTARH